jgi:hypothetical protein
MDNPIKNMFNSEMNELLSYISNKFPELNSDFIEKQIDNIISKYRPLIEEQGLNVEDILNEFIESYKKRYPNNYFFNE